jgi:hypothetical protein
VQQIDTAPKKKKEEEIIVQDIKVDFEYGLASFPHVCRPGVFFVDKTPFIPLLEKSGRCLMFLRPRRFGKSLIVSMLEHYYDVLNKNRFQELFGHLWIGKDGGKNATKERNSYLVMTLNFNSLIIDQGVKEFEASLNDTINDSITEFQDKYESILQKNVLIHSTDAVSSFNRIASLVKNHSFQVITSSY